MKINFAKHTLRMLQLSSEVLKNSPRLVEETGGVSTKGDKSIAMDVKIEEIFLDYLKKHKLPVDVFSEEIGSVKFHSRPTHIIAFDPLDGSTNYKVGKDLFPYGTLIAIYKGLKPKISEIIAAGAIEYTSNSGWVFSEGETLDLKGRKVSLQQDWPIQRSTPIYLDLAHEEYYKEYIPLAGKLYIRNSGSTVGNLAYVLSNVACGLGHPRIKAEEVGTVYALIKGAGGVVVDHQGEDIGKEEFSTEGRYKLLAGNRKTIKFVVNQLR